MTASKDNALVRAFRFSEPPHNAQQWVAEKGATAFIAPGGFVQFVAGNNFIPIGGGFAVPEGHQGLVSVVQVSVLDTTGLQAGQVLAWTLSRNGSTVPGYKSRLAKTVSQAVAATDKWTGTISTNMSPLTLAGLLTGFPSALCPVGCDYITAVIGGGAFNWTFAGTLTGNVQLTQPLISVQNFPQGIDGVLAPVWLDPLDTLQIELVSSVTTLLVAVSIGGVIWPIPSMDAL